MDAQQLMDRLEERAAEIPVGPPPIGLMRTRARRQRQGRMAVLASAAAVAAIAAGLAWQGTGGADGGSGTPIASEGPSDPDLPPDGYQYVGVGDLVAAVPQSWTRNETNCGTPTVDTVIIDPGMTCMADVPRPAGVDSLTVGASSTAGDTSEWAEIEVAGESALRSPMTTEVLWGGDASGSPLDRRDIVVQQAVVLPASGTLFVAASSSDDAEQTVRAILDSITVLHDHITVPGFQDLAFERRSDLTMVLAYVSRLQDLGLEAEVSTGKGGGLDAGTVLEVTPAVGSVVAPGDTIRVVAAR